MTPDPFWVAVAVVAVAILFSLLMEMGRQKAKPLNWYSIEGQQAYTGLRASDAVLSGPYNPDLAFFPSKETSCSTELKTWDNNTLARRPF